MYNKIVRDYFFHPLHVGSININQPLMVHLKSDQLNRGLVIDLYMQCDENSVVTNICFKTNGNPFLIASLEWLCRRVVGSRLDELSSFNREDIIKVLEIPFNQAPIILQVEDIFKEVLILMNKKLRGQS